MDTSQRAPEGVQVDEVTAWLVARRPATVAPLHFELIAGGRSNLTYVVTDALGACVVLRRPPLGYVLASAHDMGREHRVIGALADSDVPVPAVVGLSGDSSVNGAPFYVMDRVDGHVLRDAADAGAAPASRSSTSSPASTPSTSTPSGWATWDGATATSPASSRGGTASSSAPTS